MTWRLSLLLPYICAAVIGVLIVGDAALWGQPAHTDAAAAGAMPSCHAAAGAALTGGASPHGARGALGGLPSSLYYASIVMILLVSFGLIEWRATKPAAPRRRDRIDLLAIPWLRRLLVHPASRFSLQALVVGLFVLIIAAGLFGNQLPTKNIAPLLTWTVWWCGLILIILYAGKAWCYVCPWDAIAGWAEALTLWGKRRHTLSLGLRWPRWMRNIWPATLLFIGLTWLELGFGLTMRPRATAWLALMMLGMAFVAAFVFDRKSFCRYGCLVGRISGLYALFSPIEVRARDRDVCRRCTTRSCYHGSSAGEPCPTFQYLGSMDQNTYCISCMECLKTCEPGNVAVQLRPWATDLAQPRRPRADEAYLALIMLSLTGFHGLTMTPVWGQLHDHLRSRFDLGEALTFTLGMLAIMLVPILLYAALVALSRWTAGGQERRFKEHFLAYAYALLPIALFYHLAHNSGHLLMEGQRLLPLLSDPFGWEWNLLGISRWNPGPLVTMQTLWAIQILLVVIGHVYSLWAARRTALGLCSDPGAAFRSQLPMLAAMIMFSVMSMWLLKQPMEMRTSWM